MGKIIKRKDCRYSFFFVKPGNKPDINGTARRLMRIAKIREVLVTEGDYGFIVKAESILEEEEYPMLRKIAKVTEGSSRKAVSHIQFSRN